jgi:hypothetical protein
MLSGGAFAASRYLITSTKQIKPSVLRKIETHLYLQNVAGSVATMCPAGTDTTGQCEVGQSDARCPQGGYAVGGGFDGGSSPPTSATVGYDEPDTDRHGWDVIMDNQSSLSATFRAVVTCQLVVGGNAARDATQSVPRSVTTQISRDVSLTRARLTGGR